MLTSSRLKFSGSKNLKPAFLIRRLCLIVPLGLCLLLYQAWNHHDQLATQLAEHITSVTGFSRQALPPSNHHGFPRKIWYKLGPKGISENSRTWTNSCISQNPGYQYEFMTDESADIWVQKTFLSTRPDIVNAYLNLAIPILKADILRYLLLYAEGGVWSDLDVSCEGVPMDDWVPEEYREKISLVLGWEYDAGLDRSYLHQFTIWTMMAKPGAAHLRFVIDEIIKTIYQDTADWEISIPDLTHQVFGDVLDYTGPRAFSRLIIKSLEHTLGKPVDRGFIENIQEPVLIDDILILPGYAFSRAMNPFSDTDGLPLVTHHYAGSWKNDYGGELA
ncbi:Initiation-specific alpha-1,6-mannosyltransferase [Cytospora mali]|uniref:Initiation-specific alpha-1,6-mannosyltransferase n=1 Tax=Cytospora mali TaxID=578113 RepID=A0A194VW66_CYTMA|nr:Initiation-specific alpha-1,6-mannosyltransferase [Valsa mali]